MASWSAVNLKQGILSNSWLWVIVDASWSATNLKQGSIMSNSWLVVIGDGILKSKQVKARNTE